MRKLCRMIRKGRYVNVKSCVMEYTGVVHRVEDKRVWIEILNPLGRSMLVWVSRETLRGPSMKWNERHRPIDLVVTHL